MDVEEKFKRFFRRIREGNELRDRVIEHEAKAYSLPDDVENHLTTAQEYADTLPIQLIQKRTIPTYVNAARAQLKVNDREGVKVNLLKISKEYDLSRENEAILLHNAKRKKASSDGAKGGGKPKRRAWAEAMANFLVQKNYATQAEAWEAVPESFECFEYETDQVVFEVYRDDENLVGASNGKESQLAKSTFLKQYYRPAKKTYKG